MYRTTAEKAADELHRGILLRMWDHRFLTSVAKVKSVFSQRAASLREQAQSAGAGSATAMLEEPSIEPVLDEEIEELAHEAYAAASMDSLESSIRGEHELLSEDIESV